MDQVVLEKELGKIKLLTPRPHREFDQFTATTEATAKRALLMSENNDLARRRVIFLGDDDLTSIAVAMTEPAIELQVLEIDRRLVTLIKETSKRMRLGIRVTEADLRTDVPREMLGRFDVVFTDPPYTPSGVALFLNQAISVLKRTQTSRIYLCYGTSDKSRERELVIQEIINERGLVIRTKLPDFNHYSGAKSIGSKSSLYILEWTPRTRVVLADRKRVYTHE